MLQPAAAVAYQLKFTSCIVRLAGAPSWPLPTAVRHAAQPAPAATPIPNRPHPLIRSRVIPQAKGWPGLVYASSYLQGGGEEWHEGFINTVHECMHARSVSNHSMLCKPKPMLLAAQPSLSTNHTACKRAPCSVPMQPLSGCRSTCLMPPHTRALWQTVVSS